MRVLVLGGTQFVGRAIVDALLASGHEVTLTNRGQSPPTASDIWGDAVTFIAGDRVEGVRRLSRPVHLCLELSASRRRTCPSCPARRGTWPSTSVPSPQPPTPFTTHHELSGCR